MTVKYFIHYSASPMKLFGMIGMFCGAVSGLSAIATTWMKLANGVDMTGNPLLLLTALAAMVGVQFFVLGMLGELCARMYFEVRGMPNYAIRSTLNFEQQTIPAFEKIRKAA